MSGKMTSEELYRSSVGGKVSEAYIQASRLRTKASRELRHIKELMNRDGISHKDYLSLEKDYAQLSQAIRDLDMKIEVYGEVREMCIDVAQSLVEGVEE